MSVPSTSRQEYIDFLLRKFSTMEESIERIGQRCYEYGKLSEDKRTNQENEIEALNHWMKNQEWRDGVFRESIEKMEVIVNTQTESLVEKEKERMSIIEALRSEIKAIRQEVSSCKAQFSENSASGATNIDDSVLRRIRELERNVTEFSKQAMSRYTVRMSQTETYDIEDVLQKMSEWMSKKDSKDSELCEEMEQLKMKIENQDKSSVFGSDFTDIDTIRSGLTEIQKQTRDELVQQDKFNEDVIADLNRLGNCLKELCQMHDKFEKSIKENCCGECDEMKKIRECLLNQVLTNSDFRNETAAVKTEVINVVQEVESQKIKQDLFNKSLSLQIKSVRDEMKEVQEFGNDAAAEMSELRVEMKQLKQQQEREIEKVAADSLEKQTKIESFQAELVGVREAYSQLGKHLVDELDKLTCGMEIAIDVNRKVNSVKEPLDPTEANSSLFVLSPPRSSVIIKQEPSEVIVTTEDHHLTVDPASLEDTVKLIVEEALIPYRQEISMLHKQVDAMRHELNAMRKKQSKKFKGIGRLNAKILNLISSPGKEDDSVLEKSSDN